MRDLWYELCKLQKTRKAKQENEITIPLYGSLPWEVVKYKQLPLKIYTDVSLDKTPL